MDDGSTFRDPASLDHRDPNYDSEEENDRGFIPDAFHQSARDDVAKSKMTLTTFKRTIEPIIMEYFVSADVDDVIRTIQDIGAPEYSYECVKRSVNLSLDKTDRERELISRLFSVGYPDTFSSNMVGKGFERLFELVDEIEKDAPAARDMLAKFLARAVVDEVLPPSFLSDAVVCNLGGDECLLLPIFGNGNTPLTFKYFIYRRHYCSCEKNAVERSRRGSSGPLVGPRGRTPSRGDEGGSGPVLAGVPPLRGCTRSCPLHP
jgi:MA3 domain